MLDHQSAAVLFRALGDPTRLRLFELLSHGPAPVSALAEPFDMSLTAVGQHLSILESAGLIHSEKVGRVRTCACSPDAIEALDAWIGARRSLISSRLDRLGELLDDMHPPKKPDRVRTAIRRKSPR